MFDLFKLGRRAILSSVGTIVPSCAFPKNGRWCSDDNADLERHEEDTSLKLAVSSVAVLLLGSRVIVIRTGSPSTT